MSQIPVKATTKDERTAIRVYFEIAEATNNLTEYTGIKALV
jgi:hypothetical protein